MSTIVQRRENARRYGENRGDPERREFLRPIALEKIARHEQANKLLFDGLMHHYFECASTGKLDLWAKAAHAAVDLIACDRVEFNIGKNDVRSR